MQNHNDGETPNNDKPEPGDPALQGNNGSESAENKSTADENQQPNKDKKKRRTTAERLMALQAKMKEEELKERKLLKSLADDATKETSKFKSVLGGAALHALKTMESHENATKFIARLRKNVTKEDQRWADANFDRLAIQLLVLRDKDDDANGETPPQA